MTTQVTNEKQKNGAETQSEPVVSGPKTPNPFLQNIKNKQTKTPVDAKPDNKPAVPDKTERPQAQQAQTNKQSQNKQPEKQQPEKKLDFSVDYSIPTLDEIALPGEKPSMPGTGGAIPIPQHILNAELAEKSKSLKLSPELIDKLAAELQESLIPEIEKTLNFAFNNALATAMDQASKATRTIVSKRISDMLPELLKRHLEELSEESADKDTPANN